MMRRPIVFLTALVLAACSGATAPKPPSGIARVVLVADSVTVFTGSAILGQRLLAQVLDSAGQPTTYDGLIVTAPAGWLVRGDSIIAPTTETIGFVRVTATRGDLSSAVDSMAIVGVLDLREVGLTYTQTCKVVFGRPSYGSVYYPDSVTERATAESVVYAGLGQPPLAAIHPELVAAVYMTGTEEMWGRRQDSTSVDTMLAYGDVAEIRRQVPDTLTIGFGLYSGVPWPKSGATFPQWIGPGNCGSAPSNDPDLNTSVWVATTPAVFSATHLP